MPSSASWTIEVTLQIWSQQAQHRTLDDRKTFLRADKRAIERDSIVIASEDHHHTHAYVMVTGPGALSASEGGNIGSHLSEYRSVYLEIQQQEECKRVRHELSTSRNNGK